MEIKINDKISYIEANDNPLSADIGIIKANDFTYLFDVGNGFKNIDTLKETYNVILSHFHLDHIGNINLLKINKLYCSKETYKHLPREVSEKCEVIIVDNELIIDNLRIFVIPSSHAKGCLGLEIDETYTFLGDATYCNFKNNHLSYNAQLLNEEINVLKKLKSKYLLISHYNGLIRNKEDVIKELEVIYSSRERNNPYIIV